MMLSLASTLPFPTKDPWVSLFSSNISPYLLLDLLATDAVPGLDNPQTVRNLCEAFISAWRARSIKTEKNVGISVPTSSAFPSDLKSEWPVPVKHAGDGEYAAHVLGRLLAAAPPTPALAAFALDVALHHHWVPVVRQILQNFPPPNMQELRATTSSSHSRDFSPWLHFLTANDRLGELSDWLKVPYVNSSQLDPAGQTALFHAVSPAGVSLLIEHGVDKEVINKKGLSAPGVWEATSRDVRLLQKALGENGEHSIENSDIHILVSGWLSSTSDPNLSLLSTPQLGALGSTRFVINSTKGTVELGVLAYMGMNLPYFGFANPKGENVQNIEAWKRFITKAPMDWFQHESFSGVPDGWVMAAGLWKAQVSINQKLKDAVLSIHSLAVQRLEPSSQQANVYGLMVIRTLAAVLPHVSKKNNRDGWASWMNWRHSSQYGVRWPIKEPPSWPLLFKEAVEMPATRPYMLTNDAAIAVAYDGLPDLLRSRPPQEINKFWSALLVGHSQFLNETSRSSAVSYRSGQAIQQGLEDVEKNLVDEGVIPLSIKDSAIKALKKIVSQSGGKWLTPLLMSAEMNQELPKTDSLSPCRPRM